MPKPRDTTSATSSQGGRLAAAGDFDRSNKAEVKNAWPQSSFEVFLAEMSVALSNVSPGAIEREIAARLDRIACALGAERCTVGEFSANASTTHFHLQWLVGKQPKPFTSPTDSWIRRELLAGKTVAISSLDELPADAASSRQVLEERGVCSGVWVPILAEGTVLGGIGLTVVSHSRTWPEHIIRRCELVGQLIGSQLFRVRACDTLEERSQFEALVTDFSSRFMNVGDNIGVLTDEILSELGEFLKVDRVTYIEINAEENCLIPTRHWFADGIEPDYSVQGINVASKFPWLIATIKAGVPAAISKMDQFPDEAGNEKQYCEHLGIQSFAMVPATLGGAVVAALALDNISEPRVWGDDIVSRLQIVTGIIASAQDRARQNRKILELRRFEQAISRVSTAFVNLRPEAVDDAIEKGLGVVGGSLGADLITLLQPHGQAGFLTTHEWTTEEFTGPGFKGSEVSVVFPWLADQLRQNKTVAVSKLSEFPEEAAKERNAMEQAGHESVIFVPFEVRGELEGYIGVDRVEPTTWSEEIVTQLRLLGEVFGEALSRREAELGLQASFVEIQMLKEKLQQENVYLRKEVQLDSSHDEIIGESAALKAALRKVDQVAPTDSTVLILGETGTGKELMARAIHQNSSRKDKLMVKVNCAALPSSLVEAELFGREKGAYTGALNRELGRFEIADGSTILLDEIGELSLELQAKLLRVLQDGEFERLGSSKTLHVDVRVLAATNRKLHKAIIEKEFREDLFYRLNVFPIEVPPLRDRIEDIPQLVWAFVQEYSQTMGKNIDSISRASMNLLKAYSWPGNVREVRNVIERAMIVSDGPTLEIELPQHNVRETASSQKLAEVERQHVLAVVESKGWRIRGEGGAAETLGLKPTTLEARMKKLGIERTPNA